jgi:hypothetical protein
MFCHTLYRSLFVWPRSKSFREQKNKFLFFSSLVAILMKSQFCGRILSPALFQGKPNVLVRRSLGTIELKLMVKQGGKKCAKLY